MNEIRKPAAASSRPSRPKVAVVIPARNCVHLIDEQLTALAEQTFSGTYSVIVCDNGSSDGLRAHLGRHPLNERLSLEYVDASGVRGAAHARNVGANRAHADFLAFCDADDRVAPGWLAALVESGRSADIVGTGGELALDHRHGITGVTMPGQDGWTWLPFVCAGSFGVWREVWLTLGGMDATLTTAEDCDFSYRAQLRGFSIRLDPEPLFTYRMRATAPQNCRRGVAIGRGQVRIAARYHSSGHPPIRMRDLLADFCALAFVNPVTTWAHDRVSVWEWAGAAGHAIGKAIGMTELKALAAWSRGLDNARASRLRDFGRRHARRRTPGR
ncbi:glycosyltransferase [Nocardia sp. R7R-8]|uniref:glycosyltransferase n=1 Tax=Nocardia sp. R7R-8 TaxID=3459304 RepID=UPI00403DE64E